MGKYTLVDGVFTSVKRDGAGAYTVKPRSSGCSAVVYRNTELRGKAQWIAYDSYDNGVITDPVETCAEAIEAARKIVAWRVKQ
jgi:hypothetical protein